MRKSTVLVVLVSMLAFSGLFAQPRPASSDYSHWQLSDFAIDLNKLLTPPAQLWVGSGYTTVNPVLGSVLSTADLMSPPISGKNLSLEASFIANGDTIRDRFVWGSKVDNILYTGGIWQPDRIIRRGIYHRMHARGPISFEIVSHLIPLADRTGYMIRYEIKNLAASPLGIQMIPSLRPGRPSIQPLDKWAFIAPSADSVAVTKDQPNEWSTDQLKIHLYEDGNTLSIQPGSSRTGSLAVVFADKSAALEKTADFTAWEKRTNEIWAHRLQWALAKIPTIETANTALKNYYNRSIVSGLVCIWEKPNFKLNPSLVTSGMDGGSMSTYLWDVGGYAPHLITMMMGDKLLDIARNMVAIDLEKYNAYTPDGAGAGVRYAYSTVSFTNLVYALACQMELDPALLGQVKRLVLQDEHRPMINGIVDYGEQKNLLEMRGMGWEHMVPSPNSERVWCLRKLAEMGEKIGYDKAETGQWIKRSDTIASAIRKELWDEKTGWFVCKYPNGHKEWVYSIQVFDMLRSGVCTPDIKKRILEQLVENKFLFPFGVSSISKAESLHYEETDTDWGGGGAYTGDVAQLALDLYHERQPQKAWDVLRRQFWLGEQWPYFPQEHFCDRPASPTFKRANIVAGLTGAEAILFGLIGLEPRLDGSLWINPQSTIGDSITLKGFGFRGHLITVTVSRTMCRIIRDGQLIYHGKPGVFKIV